MGGYDETPAMFAADVEEYHMARPGQSGGRLLRHYSHIFELAKIVNNYTPRPCRSGGT